MEQVIKMHTYYYILTVCSFRIHVDVLHAEL
jgi:hypothetical protein